MVAQHAWKPSQDAAFEPRFLTTAGLGLYYEDGCVSGAVDVHESRHGRCLTISEWSCGERGYGHTKRALLWMRGQGFSTIVANGVGRLELFDGRLVGDIATYYWAHMNQLGLVDVLLDDDGCEVAVASDGSLRHKLRDELDLN